MKVACVAAVLACAAAAHAGAVDVPECAPGADAAWMRVAPHGLLGDWSWWRVERVDALPMLAISPRAVAPGPLVGALRGVLAAEGSDVEIVSDPELRAVVLPGAVRVGGDLAGVVEMLARSAGVPIVMQWDAARRVLELGSAARYRLRTTDPDGLALAAAVLRGSGVRVLRYRSDATLEFDADAVTLQRAGRVLRALSPRASGDPARQAAVFDAWLWRDLHDGARAALERWWMDASAQASALWRTPSVWAVAFANGGARGVADDFPLLASSQVRRLVVPEGLASAARFVPCGGPAPGALLSDAAPWLVAGFRGVDLWSNAADGGELDVRVALNAPAPGGARVPGEELSGLDVALPPGAVIVAVWPRSAVAVWLRVGWRVARGAAP